MAPRAKMQPVDILLVDDNPVDVMMMMKVFHGGRECHNLHVVEDGEEALDFVYKRGRYSSAPSPQIILLDLNLPKKDGREVLAEIKQDQSLKHIPVIILTGSESRDDVWNSYELQANCFITKSVGMKQFTEDLECLKEFWLSRVRLPSRLN